MKLLEQGQGESHSHYRYKARQAKEIVVGDCVMKQGSRLQVESVVWTFQQGEQLLWTSFGVRNIDNNATYLLAFQLGEWAIVDSFKSRECGCQ